MREAGAQQVVEKAAQAFYGWTLLIVGVAVLGALVLLPAYRQTQQLHWQREVVTRQTQHVQNQAQAYRQALAALNSGDRELLHTLAYRHLHLQPLGVQVIDIEAQAAVAAICFDDPDSMRPPPDAMRRSVLETLIERPMPQPDTPMPGMEPDGSYLSLLLEGPLRPFAFCVAIGCISLSLLLPMLSDLSRQAA
jgi:hypothetical protein